MKKRDRIPRQLEVTSSLLENEKIVEILGMFKPEMTVPAMNGLVMRILAEAMRHDKDAMDELAALHEDKSVEEIDEMDDKEYVSVLRAAILEDVLGFFG